MCMSCGHAYQPHLVLGHIKDRHGISTNAADHESWSSTVKTFNPKMNFKNIKGPSDKVPVPILKLEQGVCCNFCDYCCPKKSTFRNHWNEKHQDLTQQVKEGGGKQSHDG